jgi:hypothetical protein
MNAESTRSYRVPTRRRRFERSPLVPSAALLAAMLALFASRSARADDELPPPPPPPAGVVLAAEPRDAVAEPTDDAAKPKHGGALASPDAAKPSSSADTPPNDGTPGQDTSGTEEVWYGYQILLADGASLGCVLLGAGTDSSGLPALGGVGYVFGGPIVHFAHGEVGRGFGSLGLRVGLPVLGVLVGVGGTSDDSGPDSPDGSAGGQEGLAAAAVGAMIGMVGAVVLDSAALAYEQVPVDPRKKGRDALQLVPTVGWSPTGVSFGLVGAL